MNLHEAEALAREKLPIGVFDFYSGGANDELSLAANRSIYDGVSLRPRVLVDVSARDMATSLLGTGVTAPVVIAPMAFQRMAHPTGELAVSRAAAAMNLIMTVSTFATCSMEDIAQAAPGTRWFQLYVHRDRGFTRDMVQRVEAAGYAALVLTVDVPELGRRERDLRHGFALTPGLRFANFVDDGGSVNGVDLYAFVEGMHDATLSWKDVEWLRGLSKMPVILKGVVRGDDASRAVQHGAAGIVVSNHGGRQLDTAVTGLQALPEVVEAVAGKALVMVDGGIRRGTDVLKALAFGADAVMLGRPVLWGLALDGEAGATRILELMLEELDKAMALCGAPRLSDITRDLIA